MKKIIIGIAVIACIAIGYFVFFSEPPYEEFEVQTEQAVYTFGNRVWNQQKIDESLPIFDEAIIFTKDLFQIEHDEPLKVFFDTQDFDDRGLGSQGYVVNDGRIFMLSHDDIERNSIDLAHEATHALFRLNVQLTPPPTYLIEGVAVFAGWRYMIDIDASQIQRDSEFYKAYRDGTTTDPTHIAFFELYDSLISEDESGFDMMIMGDTRAVRDTMSEFAHLRSSLHANSSTLQPGHGRDTYQQAGSFVNFLYKTYGIEQLKEIYRRPANTEELVGLNIMEIIALWHESIGL
jgi:hypothetical protein